MTETPSHTIARDPDLTALARDIKAWARELGFQQCGITDTDTGRHAEHFQAWLDAGYHGDMDWLPRHAAKRVNPSVLEPGTQRVICVRMDYLPAGVDTLEALREPDRAYVARYALGRDYHKLMRKRLARIARRLNDVTGGRARACVDSAPVLERALAEKAGLGWIGKNTMLIHPEAGGWFFLGEILTDLPLPVDPPFGKEHCGTCTACLDICPTRAFRGPHELDARRCISYLTIEHRGAIPEALRPQLGNRVFGCDDCTAVCPWNRFARFSPEDDFQPRHNLDHARLVALFRWDEATFLEKTAGSAIRRAGYTGWLRNLAVALGNGPATPEVLQALREKQAHPSALVREHVTWALKTLDADAS